MNCIATIKDEDFNLKSRPLNNPRIRYGARGIVLDSSGNIALLNKKMKNEYKLIGGGIDNNENAVEAFIRECLEETGCIVEVDRELGYAEEIKTLDNFKQISYIFVAHVVKDTKKTNLTEQELKEKSEVVWTNKNNALSLIKNSMTKILPSEFEGELSVYHSKFIIKRDYEILKYYLSKMNKGIISYT